MEQGAAWKPGIDPAEPPWLCCEVPGLEVPRRPARCASLRNKLLPLRRAVARASPYRALYQHGGATPSEKSSAKGVWPQSRLSRCVPAASGNLLVLAKQLLSSAQPADDLLGVVASAFHGAAPGQVWSVGKLS